VAPTRGVGHRANNDIALSEHRIVGAEGVRSGLRGRPNLGQEPDVGIVVPKPGAL
jgi:hypothetical protein